MYQTVLLLSLCAILATADRDFILGSTDDGIKFIRENYAQQLKNYEMELEQFAQETSLTENELNSAVYESKLIISDTYTRVNAMKPMVFKGKCFSAYKSAVPTYLAAETHIIQCVVSNQIPDLLTSLSAIIDSLKRFYTHYFEKEIVDCEKHKKETKNYSGCVNNVILKTSKEFELNYKQFDDDILNAKMGAEENLNNAISCINAEKKDLTEKTKTAEMLLHNCVEDECQECLRNWTCLIKYPDCQKISFRN